jgi:hypothetical protein
VQREVALEAPRRRKRVRRTHQRPPDTSGDQPARTTADGSAERSA